MPDLFADQSMMEPLWRQLPGGMHPTLVEMAEHMYLHLVADQAAAALGHDHLAQIVIGQVDRVAAACGGSSFYLPRGILSRLSERDRQIAARFNGRNKRELAREYDLTEMRIDQIVAAVRLADFQRRQGKLDLPD
ncbi:Mor transcription activator family protein [Azonexus fungiphilus]|uniref:Mor transcription activator family protein n=1 Tax=Azonexus fungiphilus TaxID=146940 RepID=UPI00156AC864|nr:Mor transcription activator family protein [Azonexus fungiphilus]NHC05926.1 DNA-binding protein [Azonexus fungiphilus]